MVTKGKRLDRSGKSKFGCLLTLLLIGGVVYYGVDWGQAYLKNWQLREEMKTQAVLSSGIDDATIHRRMLRKIENLGLPDAAKSNIRIRRTFRPREIVISTSYEMLLRLPFRAPYVLKLNPEARQPL